jgi:hypothetical protein
MTIDLMGVLSSILTHYYTLLLLNLILFIDAYLNDILTLDFRR